MCHTENWKIKVPKNRHQAVKLLRCKDSNILCKCLWGQMLSSSLAHTHRHTNLQCQTVNCHNWRVVVKVCAWAWDKLDLVPCRQPLCEQNLQSERSAQQLLLTGTPQCWVCFRGSYSLMTLLLYSPLNNNHFTTSLWQKEFLMETSFKLF